jgi:hypothetical protein
MHSAERAITVLKAMSGSPLSFAIWKLWCVFPLDPRNLYTTAWGDSCDITATWVHRPTHTEMRLNIWLQRSPRFGAYTSVSVLLQHKQEEKCEADRWMNMSKGEDWHLVGRDTVYSGRNFADILEELTASFFSVEEKQATSEKQTLSFS